MPERYTHRILSHVTDRRYRPKHAKELAQDLGVPDEDFNDFRTALDQLLDDEQVVLGDADAIALPPPGREMTGKFRLHERGFGFIIPESPTEHGDLFVPPEHTNNAMTGDTVRARVIHNKSRAGGDRSPYTGRILEIVERGNNIYVGNLDKRGKQWVVEADGKSMSTPIIVRDPGAKDATRGDKVVVELTKFPDDGEWPEGVITEVLGEKGEPSVETQAVIKAFGLPEEFPGQVQEEARASAARFDEDRVPEDRDDLTDTLICTIDPPDARDFDDAISLRKLEGGDPRKSDFPGAAYELGVHIADVSYFVRTKTALDDEARQRGNSTYLPRKVIPMLPELLSNGVCSLQEGVNRNAKSAFMYYDNGGNVVGQRFGSSVIRSRKRMTYLEAQALIDGDLREARRHAKTEPHYPSEVIQLVKRMDELARLIRKRRFRDGMIVLELPEVELIYDDSGRVTDAEPEDDAFTHKIIEAFMVEANEAVARLFDNMDVPMIRRIHPDPDALDFGDLRSFARVAGFNIPAHPNRNELQELLDSVRGKPAQRAVHLAVLKTLSKAEYSPMLIGHFALASEHYTHFTSPIRRYPDLIVHRALAAYLEERDKSGKTGGKRKNANKRLGKAVAEHPQVPGEQELVEMGKHCSATERRSEKAERDLTAFLVLQLMADHMGDDFAGTVTGVTGGGIFIQLDRYLCEGFVKTTDLPGPDSERWNLNRSTGQLVAQRSGRIIQLGDTFNVRVANVDPARRKMDLTILETKGKKKFAPNQKAQNNKTRKKSSAHPKGQDGDNRRGQDKKKSKPQGKRGGKSSSKGGASAQGSPGKKKSRRGKGGGKGKGKGKGKPS